MTHDNSDEVWCPAKHSVNRNGEWRHMEKKANSLFAGPQTNLLHGHSAGRFK